MHRKQMNSVSMIRNTKLQKNFRKLRYRRDFRQQRLYAEKEISAAQMKNNADTVLVWLENTADSADKGMYLLDRERGGSSVYLHCRKRGFFL